MHDAGETETNQPPMSEIIETPSSTRLRQVLERILQEGKMVAELDGTMHQVFPVGIDQGEGEALRNWVIREKATNTLEIGLAYGISAFHLRWSARERFGWSTARCP